MVKKKKQLRGKKHARKKYQAANSNKKIKKTKRKSHRVRGNSKPSKIKKKTKPTRIIGRNKKVKIAADRKFWNNRKRRTATPRKRAAYSTKSLRARTTGIPFRVKKKMKQTKPLGYDNASFNTLLKGSANYLKLKKKDSKPKKVYLKACIRDSKGNQRFISVARQEMSNRSDLAAAWRLMLVQLRYGYENSSIIGYEVEEVL